MPEPGNHEAVEPRSPQQEVERVFAYQVPKVIDMYTELLEKDSGFLRRADLGRLSGEGLDRHIKQLHDLRLFVTQFAEDPSRFMVRHRRDDADSGITVARLKRVGEGPLLMGPENAQVQYSFHVQKRDDLRNRVEAIRNASLSGVAPHVAAQRADREVNSKIVTLNSNALYLSAQGETRVVPMAGIRASITGEEKDEIVDLDGVSFVGPHPHLAPISNEEDFSTDDFQTFLATSTRLARYGSPGPINTAELLK